MTDLLTEVVLALLLSKFKFASLGKDIVWEMSAITLPAIKGRPGIPTMPLKVVPLRSSA